jgi:hypothetical protein
MKPANANQTQQRPVWFQLCSRQHLAGLSLLLVAGCGGGGGDSTGSKFQPVPSSTGPTLDILPNATKEASVLVTGSALETKSSILIQGGSQAVTVPVNSDRSFAASVPLQLNKKNQLFATELFAAGTKSPVHPASIVQDSNPPSLWIDFPTEGSEVNSANINVSGRVSDTLSGFQGLKVLVGNDLVGFQEADVDIGIGTNGTFDLANFPLLSGAPTAIEVRAEDALGNLQTESVTVSYVPPSGSKLLFYGGANQAGQVLTWLPQPVEVQVTRPDNTPYAGKLVTFEVVKSDGRLSSDGQGEGTLTLTVPADSQGIARARWRLGAEAGCGNNRVRVTSNDVAGTAFVCASSTAAPPVQINLGSGNNQTGQAPGPAAHPLRVWVSDGCNPATGVAVEFRVVQGDGEVAGPNGVLTSSVQVLTGPTGHAEARFEYGILPGTNRVEASFPGNKTRPVVFALYGEGAGSEPTRYRGQVADNALQPIGGALARLVAEDGTELATHSEPDGTFLLDDIPFSGPADLYVEGESALTLGGTPINPNQVRFPGLHYEVVVLEGVENSLTGPVLLPGLNPLNDVLYDGSQDITLRVEGIEGLEMYIEAGSMTLADGTQPTPKNPLSVPIRVALNQVHHDDVPMPMPDGVAPPFAWTLQPAGAHFDPPVAIRYPNMSGLPAGAAAYFLSFDHDTAQFEIVSSASVTPDAQYILSDPGSGLTVAGWGCNCPPYAVTGDCENCIVNCVAPGTVEVEGKVTTERLVYCVGEDAEIVFEAPDGSDSGGGKEEECPDGSGQSTTIDSVDVTVKWSVTRNGTEIASGKGLSTEPIMPSEEGKLRAKFTYTAERECPPAPVVRESEEVHVIKVRFDPLLVKEGNVLTGIGAFTIPLIQDSATKEYDLDQFLAPELRELDIDWEWSVDDTFLGILIPDFDDKISATPQDLSPYRARIYAQAPDCDEDVESSHAETYLVIVSKTESDAFDGWKTSNVNLSWLEDLPDPMAFHAFDSLTGLIAVDPDPDNCIGWDFNTFAFYFTKAYHPGAEREMRTPGKNGPQGHQATYDAAGNLLNGTGASLGLAAGTADRHSPVGTQGSTPEHVLKDVDPFIRAAQLDGNPIEKSLGGGTLSGPFLRVDTNLNSYFKLRPPFKAGATGTSLQPFTPGNCPP